MNIVGLIGTGVAFARYQKAKKAYEDLQAQKKTLEKSIDKAAEDKKDILQDALGDKINSNRELQNLKVSATLHISKIKKTIIKASLYLDLLNTGGSSIYISSVEVATFLHGLEFSFGKNNKKKYVDEQRVLTPGTPCSIEVVKNKWGTFSSTSKADRHAEKKYLLDLIEQYGKGKDISGLLTIDANIEWSAKRGIKLNTARYEQKDGIVTYKS